MLTQSSLFLGNNLYIYSNNNPVNYKDENGHKSFGLIKWVSDNVVKPIVRGTTKVLSGIAKMIGLKNTSDLYNNSLKDKNGNLCYGPNSNIAKDIKNSKVFKNTIDEIIVNEGSNATFDHNKYDLIFDRPDLFLALHKTDIYIDGNLSDGKGYLGITIQDKYNFEYWHFELKKFYLLPIDIINNIGYYEQELGYISPYDFYIMFDYYIE